MAFQGSAGNLEFAELICALGVKQLLITCCIVRKQVVKQPLWLRLESIQGSVLGSQEGQNLFQSKSVRGLERFRGDGAGPKLQAVGITHLGSWDPDCSESRV